ncbi:MAG: hypothetical protein ACRC0E_04470 [Soonwooa sp.]
MKKTLDYEKISIETKAENDLLQINSQVTSLEENMLRHDRLTLGTYKHINFSGLVKVKIVEDASFGK